MNEKDELLIDCVIGMLDYEDGELQEHETIELFSNLIKSGTVWKLQGSYGRTAQRLIESGILNRAGDIINTNTQND